MNGKSMTMCEHFLARNPDAPKGADGNPRCCPWELGYDGHTWDTFSDHCDVIGGCINCWSREMRKDCVEDAVGISEGDDHQNEDRCICCGAYVPEGRQVCVKCERSNQ